MFARLALVILTLLATSAAFAQVYQWRDEQGKVHFTDTPPPESRNVTEQKLQVNTIQGWTTLRSSAPRLARCSRTTRKS
ncbi:hypothetical protein PSm6_42740 [Pseudomonas solani]|uniref:DUF4124 domain-containing protein n=1 Tax=Pseudomonas solani TaxID=2731552 RepID=A0ABM7LET2_9PSED|nr:DUF4124 domain-containing protein [Pseudomonas solani]BCD87867.1 hypothetical protein PSm6_42740 [Pseudomonas solani]